MRREQTLDDINLRPGRDGGDSLQIQNEMTLEMLALPENVGLARVAVAAFASQLDFSMGEIEEIRVAVSEAVSNAVIHAYGREGGRVTITCRLMNRTLEVVIRDYGKGIADIEQARQPSFSTEEGRMGLGFVFMESFMDGLDVISVPGKGTTVRMWKECRAVEGSQD